VELAVSVQAEACAVTAALRRLGGTETLQRANTVECVACQSRTNTARFATITHLPDVLVVLLRPSATKEVPYDARGRAFLV
jgi:ubiquitin C-terminal hydrolase